METGTKVKISYENLNYSEDSMSQAMLWPPPTYELSTHYHLCAEIILRIGLEINSMN
jgi:hypothetical protein